MALKMLLRDNWIHGDLHAGNILCPADPGDERVFVLDAGHLTFATSDERHSSSPNPRDVPHCVEHTAWNSVFHTACAAASALDLEPRRIG
jgi:hypothetical protein